jgi:nucleoside 2-deoxyribosyltransferase
MKKRKTPFRVYISHQSDDLSLVRDMARRLELQGIQPVAPLRGELSIKEYREIVRDEIRNADAVILLVTPASLKADWVVYENGMAQGLRKPVWVVTAGLGDKLLPAPLPHQVVSYDQLDEAIAELAQQVQPSASTAS